MPATLCFHLQEPEYLGSAAVRVGQQESLAVIEPVANVLIGVCRNIEENLTSSVNDRHAFADRRQPPGIGHQVAAAVIDAEGQLNEPIFIPRDLEKRLVRRSVDERRRGPWCPFIPQLQRHSSLELAESAV